MRLLLDAHTLIWAVEAPHRLGKSAVEALSNPDHIRLVSLATAWEISIKTGSEKLTLSRPFRSWIEQAVLDLVAIELPIAFSHVELAGKLPRFHKDPFDRMIIAQALVEGCAIVGADRWFDAYGVERIWD